VVHGRVPGFTEAKWELADLHHLAAALGGSRATRYAPPATDRIEPREVVPGVWAADLDGARHSSTDFAVVSLCRTGSRFPHGVQRFAFLSDDEQNSEVDAVLDDVLQNIAALRAEGRPVLVHCHGGASRTGLVLRACCAAVRDCPRRMRRPPWRALARTGQWTSRRQCLSLALVEGPSRDDVGLRRRALELASRTAPEASRHGTVAEPSPDLPLLASGARRSMRVHAPRRGSVSVSQMDRRR
jgi:hypothetical protein